MSTASREALAAAARYREAVAANEDLVQRQRAELASSRQLNASYEGRIRSLESCLAASTMAASTRSSQQLAAELALHDPALRQQPATAAASNAPQETAALEAAPSLAGPMDAQAAQVGADLGEGQEQGGAGQEAADGDTEFQGFGSARVSSQAHKAEQSSLPGAMAKGMSMLVCFTRQSSEQGCIIKCWRDAGWHCESLLSVPSVSCLHSSPLPVLLSFCHSSESVMQMKRSQSSIMRSSCVYAFMLKEAMSSCLLWILSSLFWKLVHMHT